jgi:voltage-gated potassium channel
MIPLRRLVIAIGALALITGVGTVGYVLIEEVSWLDALYMTVITLSTVGYKEVAPLDPGGKLFTMALIVVGVGMSLYLLSQIAEVLVEGRLRDFFQGNAMTRRIESLEGHVIVCGYGRFGRVVVAELQAKGESLAIVERDPGLEADLAQTGAAYLVASATSEEALERAGIERARAIVIATGSDAENVFIALSARERNPSIRIHARGESDAAVRRLALAGADQVVSPYHIGGMRVAAAILRPAVVDSLEIAHEHSGAEVDLQELRVSAGSAMPGQTVGWVEAQAPRVRVVALKRGAEPIRIVPDGDTEITGGDHLVLIGEGQSLSRLARHASDASSS